MQAFAEETEVRQVVQGENEGEGDRQVGLEEDVRRHRLHHRARPYCLLLSSCLPPEVRQTSWLEN